MISGITHTVGTREGSVDGGGNGLGEKLNQSHYPTGISFDRQGNLYIGSQSI